MYQYSTGLYQHSAYTEGLQVIQPGVIICIMTLLRKTIQCLLHKGQPFHQIYFCKNQEQHLLLRELKVPGDILFLSCTIIISLCI